MSHRVAFFRFGCTKCRRLFEWPSLGDMNYGEWLLHGEHGTVHRCVYLLNHPVCAMVDSVLGREGSIQQIHVLAELADPAEGQRLGVDAVCPNCGADVTHFRTPQESAKGRRLADVDDATFTAFLALSEDVQRERIVTIATSRQR